MMDQLRAVLVVMPVLNEAEHLPALLPKILSDAGDATVVIADGGSTDASRAIVKAYCKKHGNLILLDNPARAQSAGINLAVRHFGAGRKWLVRIDAHAGYPDAYVSALVACGNKLNVSSVVVSMHTRGIKCFQRSIAAAQNSVIGTGGSPHRHRGKGRFVDHGHHALMRIDAFCRVGGYCETFTHNEDAELDHRLRLGGGQIWLEPSLAIIYYPRSDPFTLFTQYRKYGQGRARNQQRHRMPIKFRQMAPLVIMPAVLALLFVPFSLIFAVPFIGWVATSIGYGLYLGLRARSRCIALAGIAAMIMHSAWAIGYLHQRLFCRAPGPSPSDWFTIDNIAQNTAEPLL